MLYCFPPNMRTPNLMSRFLTAALLPVALDWWSGGSLLSEQWAHVASVGCAVLLFSCMEALGKLDSKRAWKATMFAASTYITVLYVRGGGPWWSGFQRSDVLSSVHFARSEKGAPIPFAPAMYAVHLVWTGLEILRDLVLLDRSRKDYALMLIHHPMTLTLVAGSYLCGYHHVGTDIMFLCHVTDAMLYAGLSLMGTARLHAVGTLCFLLNMGTWGWFRIYRLWTSNLFNPVAMHNIVGGGMAGGMLMGFLWVLLAMNVIWYAWMWERLIFALRQGTRTSARKSV